METQTPVTSLIPWKALIVGILLSVVVADLVVLNILVLRKQSAPQEVVVSGVTPQTCPSACIAAITEATASVALPTIYPVPSPVATQAPSRAEPREYYIPLGGGLSTSKRDWTDMVGVETYINSAKYSGRLTVTWDATLKILSGNGVAYARLVNVTDNQILYETEISGSAENGVRVESSPFKLAQGNKLYRVQLKSNTGYEATIASGRIKIVIE